MMEAKLPSALPTKSIEQSSTSAINSYRVQYHCGGGNICVTNSDIPGAPYWPTAWMMLAQIVVLVRRPSQIAYQPYRRDDCPQISLQRPRRGRRQGHGSALPWQP